MFATCKVKETNKFLIFAFILWHLPRNKFEFQVQTFLNYSDHIPVDMKQHMVQVQVKKEKTMEQASDHTLIGCYGQHRRPWHALIGWYGQHRRPVARSNLLLWPTPQASGTL